MCLLLCGNLRSNLYLAVWQDSILLNMKSLVLLFSLFLISTQLVCAHNLNDFPGCNDPGACNFNQGATSDDGSCDYDADDCLPNTPSGEEWSSHELNILGTFSNGISGYCFQLIDQLALCCLQSAEVPSRPKKTH
jgi:hypothetical protein